MAEVAFVAFGAHAQTSKLGHAPPLKSLFR
jgi:hypothetical protein